MPLILTSYRFEMSFDLIFGVKNLDALGVWIVSNRKWSRDGEGILPAKKVCSMIPLIIQPKREVSNVLLRIDKISP